MLPTNKTENIFLLEDKKVPNDRSIAFTLHTCLSVSKTLLKRLQSSWDDILWKGSNFLVIKEQLRD